MGDDNCAAELTIGEGQIATVVPGSRKHTDGKFSSKFLILYNQICKGLNVRKKSEYTGKNLNLTTKIALLYRNFYQIKNHKNLNFEPVYLNFTKIQEKKSE